VHVLRKYLPIKGNYDHHELLDMIPHLLMEAALLVDEGSFVLSSEEICLLVQISGFKIIFDDVLTLNAEAWVPVDVRFVLHVVPSSYLREVLLLKKEHHQEDDVCEYTKEGSYVPRVACRPRELMNADQVVNSGGEGLRDDLFIAALVIVEGVDWGSAEQGKLVQELQGNDSEHIRHHELPELCTGKRILEQRVAQDSQHDEESQ